MGENYGSTWTALLYMMMIFMIFSFIIMGTEIVNFQGGIRKIDDGLKEADYNVMNKLPRKFRICDETKIAPETIVETIDPCTGITDIDYVNGEIRYQIDFNGEYMNFDGSDNKEFIVNLSY